MTHTPAQDIEPDETDRPLTYQEIEFLVALIGTDTDHRMPLSGRYAIEWQARYPGWYTLTSSGFPDRGALQKPLEDVVARYRQHVNQSVRDEGSVLLATLFALIVMALLMVVSMSAVTGQVKAQTSRVHAIAAQSVTAATSEATMAANLGKFTTAQVTGGGDTAVGEYTWTATRRASTPGVADLTVTVNVNDEPRIYEGVLKEVPVDWAVRATSGKVHYQPRSPQGTGVVWQVETSPAYTG